MPAERDDRAEDQAERDQRVVGRRSRWTSSRRTSARGTSRATSVDERDLDEAADDREDREAGHRDLHRQLALGDVVVGAGEADVGVLDLAGGRVAAARRVVEVAVLELARLRRPARPRTRGRSSATCRWRSGTRRRSRRRRGSSASRPRSPTTSRISSLEKKPENGGTPASARPPTTKQPNVNGIALRKPPILSRFCSPRHRADHRAGRHEQQRLEEGVRHEVEQARDVGAGATRHDHVADLRHRRVGDDALEVGHDEADRAGDEQRQRADDRADVGGRGRELEQRVHARDQVDARGDHRRRVDQRGDRRRALHRVREPRVQRDLRGLRERADEQQEQPAMRSASRCAEDVAAPARTCRGSPACRCAEDEERPEHEADVADDVDDERLDARARRRLRRYQKEISR